MAVMAGVRLLASLSTVVLRHFHDDSRRDFARRAWSFVLAYVMIGGTVSLWPLLGRYPTVSWVFSEV